MIFEAFRPRATLRNLLGLIVVAGGCGGGESGPKIHPVSGKLLIDGKPAEKARITFHPARSPSKSGLIPYAETDADGVFRPSSILAGDGAPAGDYKVTVFWPAITIDHGEEVAGPDRLGGRYSTPQKSNLTATIKEGENALAPFELRSSR